MSDFDSRAHKAADSVRQQIAANPLHDEQGIRRAQRSRARAVIPSAVAAAAVLIVGVAVALPRGAIPEHRLVEGRPRSRWQER